MELTLQKLLETARRWTVPNLKHFKETRQPVVWLLAPFIGLATGAAAGSRWSIPPLAARS